MSTTPRELADQNFAATSICRNEQKGVLLQASFPSLSSSPLPDSCYAHQVKKKIPIENSYKVI